MRFNSYVGSGEPGLLPDHCLVLICQLGQSIVAFGSEQLDEFWVKEDIVVSANNCIRADPDLDAISRSPG